MAKKKLGGGIDFKKLLLEKGERYGFYLAGGLLVVFLAFGAITAVNSASSGTIVKQFDTQSAEVERKVNSNSNTPIDPIDPVVFQDSTVPHIPFTLYAARNNLWDLARDERTKRVNPKILPPTEAQVEFVHGSVSVYDIIEQDGKRLIAVVRDRPAAKANTAGIRRVRKGGNRPPPPTPAPSAPPAAGGPGGERSGRGGPGRGGPGGMGVQTERTSEPEVQYAPVDAREIDSAKLAETIEPHRMVVVSLGVPYKQQVEVYRAALRARTVEELTEFPVYAGFVVERQQWSADGRAMEADWAPLDLQTSLGELFSKTIDFEPENPPADLDAALRTLYPRILPPDEYRLLVPRPKLYRGEYPAANLPSIAAALKTLKDLNQTGVEIRTQTEQRLQDTDIFQRSGGQNQPAGGGLPGGGGPIGPPGRGGVVPPGMRFPAPGAGGAPGQGNAPVVAEDAWLMRFIDVTVDPGHSYRYRVSLKAKNPNYRKPAKDLAIPAFAEKDMLQSDWFELPAVAAPKDVADARPPVVGVPQEEFLYAAAKDDRRNRMTEKMPGPSTWDDTWVQMQRWYERITVPEINPSRSEPFGEWLVANIRAVRGQYVGGKESVILPVWTEAHGAFLFRDNPRTTRPANPTLVGSRSRSEPTWTLDLSPTPPVLLVDFEGGDGTYLYPRKTGEGKTVLNTWKDTSGVEMLLMSADGRLRVARSGQDLNDADRAKREEAWNAWQRKVAEDTITSKNGGSGGGSGGAIAPGAGRP